MEIEQVETTTNAALFRRPAVRKRTVTDKTEYCLIKVEPPSGWTVEPRELKVAESTTHADFALKPK